MWVVLDTRIGPSCETRELSVGDFLGEFWGPKKKKKFFGTPKLPKKKVAPKTILSCSERVWEKKIFSSLIENFLL
jgi:hypothetical protein